MNGLISLAKENAFMVIGLLLVTLYLQDRIHGESLSIRQEMSAELAAVRHEMSGFGERLARIETLVEQLLLEKRGR